LVHIDVTGFNVSDIGFHVSDISWKVRS